MTLRTFIRTHRAEIDKHIRKYAANLTIRYNDHDRELWVFNDESLYRWAKSEGVRL